MSVAKVIEISAMSETSFEDAIQEGIARATSTMQHVTGAWIKEQQVIIENNKVTQYKVNMNVTFILNDATANQ